MLMAYDFRKNVGVILGSYFVCFRRILSNIKKTARQQFVILLKVGYRL